MEIDPSTTHPNPLPNPHHRKIELQSPLDLTYLEFNTAASARQKLDLHFPPNASQPDHSSSTDPALLSSTITDPMRQRVQDLVAQFLDRTWGAAKPNISINGSDATTAVPLQSATGTDIKEREEIEGVDFEYEPYDPRLSSKVAALYGELEALTAGVSMLRRTAPERAAGQFGSMLGEVLEEDFKVGRDVVGKDVGGGEGGGEGGLKLDPVREGWEEEVAGMYERGLGELRRLGGHAGGGPVGEGSGSLTGLRPKVERARDAVAELE